eukprot:4905977-Amphidinium_carterae.1
MGDRYLTAKWPPISEGHQLYARNPPAEARQDDDQTWVVKDLGDTTTDEDDECFAYCEDHAWLPTLVTRFEILEHSPSH